MLDDAGARPVTAPVPLGAPPSVSAAQMAQVDRLAVGTFGIDLLQMMELAGSHLAEVTRLELGGDLRGRTVVVAAGSGNNGGGGLAGARHLVNHGADVRVVLARPASRLSGAGRHQLATLLAMGVDCCVMTYDIADDDLAASLGNATVIVDAVLGYGIGGPPHGEVARLIRFVMSAGRPVISLDIPSGVNPDTGESAGVAVTADATLTLALPKAGLLTAAGQPRTGRLYVGDLGLPAVLYRSLGIEPWLLFDEGPIHRLDGAPDA